jgi:hypothetical protein
MDEHARTGRKSDRPSFRPTLAEIVAATAMVAAVPAALLLFPGHLVEVIGGITAVAGAGKAVMAHLHPEDDDALPPASAAFLAAADLRRPLPPATPAGHPGLPAGETIDPPLQHSADATDRR